MIIIVRKTLQQFQHQQLHHSNHHHRYWLVMALTLLLHIKSNYYSFRLFSLSSTTRTFQLLKSSSYGSINSVFSKKGIILLSTLDNKNNRRKSIGISSRSSSRIRNKVTITPLAMTINIRERIMYDDMKEKSSKIDNNIDNTIQIAIIGGGGAAGLTTARAFQKYINDITTCNNNDNKKPSSIQITVLEKGSSIGGVWNYQKQMIQQPDATTDTIINTNPTEEEDGTQQQQIKRHPMYHNLRTNLPKEIMAFREYPIWPDDDDNNNNTSSFVSHSIVNEYLNEYAKHYQLETNIQYNCNVQTLKILNKDSSNSLWLTHNNNNKHQTTNNDTTEEIMEVEYLPKTELSWIESKNDNGSSNITSSSNIFDIVVICNGHYSKPSIPHIPGLKEYYNGTILHSMDYNVPEVFLGKTILCIGARASGSDIAREISHMASDNNIVNEKYTTHIYISDSTYQESIPVTQNNVTMVPRTKCILPNGTIQFDYNCTITPKVDIMMFCSGYDYDFPFIIHDDNEEIVHEHNHPVPMNDDNENNHHDINNKSNGEYQSLIFDCHNRCVKPLYQQLFHAQYPNIAFIGIPHSVIPFPLFEIQAQAVVYQLLHNPLKNNGTTIKQMNITKSLKSNDERNTDCEQVNEDNNRLYVLPNQIERMRIAKLDSLSGGPEINGRIPYDTHYLGSYQWDYCRTMSKYANVYTENYETYLQTNKVRAFDLLFVFPEQNRKQ